MDQIDMAAEQEQGFLGEALKYHSIPRGPSAIFNSAGKPICLYEGCGTVLPAGQRWCGVNCRDGWQVDQDTKARNGRKAA